MDYCQVYEIVNKIFRKDDMKSANTRYHFAFCLCVLVCFLKRKERAGERETDRRRMNVREWNRRLENGSMKQMCLPNMSIVHAFRQFSNWTTNNTTV